MRPHAYNGDAVRRWWSCRVDSLMVHSWMVDSWMCVCARVWSRHLRCLLHFAPRPCVRRWSAPTMNPQPKFKKMKCCVCGPSCLTQTSPLSRLEGVGQDWQDWQDWQDKKPQPEIHQECLHTRSVASQRHAQVVELMNRVRVCACVWLRHLRCSHASCTSPTRTQVVGPNRPAARHDCFGE
jgi:hypothetical protein